MLSKLKRRMILSGIIPVTLILLAIFVVVTVVVTRMRYDALSTSLDLALQGAPPQIGPGGADRSYMDICTILVEPSGQIVALPGATMDAEVIEQVARAVVESGEPEARIGSMGLLYKSKSTPNGLRIAFASTHNYYTAVRNTVLITGGACSLMLACVYVVVVFQARAAVRPVEEAWEQQRRFVADASHDLKTPLTVVLANLDILSAHLENLPEEERRWLDSTREEAERMKGLTLSLLELAKTENLRDTLTLAPTELSTLTEQTVLQYEPVAFEAGVSIATDIHPEIVLPSHDATYIGLVETLVDNAVKYSPREGTVTVSLEEVRGRAQLSVHNTGEPIPAEELPYIFERFRRADKARGDGGFGLGLAIAENMAKALGGSLHVTSSETAGTTFTLLLKK